MRHKRGNRVQIPDDPVTVNGLTARKSEYLPSAIWTGFL